MAQTLFEIRELTKLYGDGPLAVRALDHVSLDLMKGEMLVLLGPSGSGKSTFLNIVGGLDRASSGSVKFDGDEVTAMDDGHLTRYRRARIGFIFQFYNLIPSLTAWENVALVTEISPNPMTPDEALERVGLKDRKTHFPAQLSGGEQQRVAVARAIAKRPQVLLCDEPTGALDSRTGVLVLEALAAANADLGATTAIITHNAGIHAIADRVIHFRDGKVGEVVVNDKRLLPAQIEW